MYFSSLFCVKNHLSLPLSLSHIHYSFGVKDILTDIVKMTPVL